MLFRSPGVSMCPPEGDAGTGMVATNSIAPRTGNVSAGTSIFAMIVLENNLRETHTEIDVVATPDGLPVAMVHCNNCTSELDAWVKLFDRFASSIGMTLSKTKLYKTLYQMALDGAADAGGLLSYNNISGEPVVGLEEGRPLFTRLPDSMFTLENFMRTLLYGAIAALKLGMDILTENENVTVDTLTGHGGLFKTPEVGQRIMAGALGIPVSVMESAGEGGAWGIALLAKYAVDRENGETLRDYLRRYVFDGMQSLRIDPDMDITAGFESYIERYKQGLAAERAAIEHIK